MMLLLLLLLLTRNGRLSNLPRLIPMLEHLVQIPSYLGLTVYMPVITDEGLSVEPYVVVPFCTSSSSSGSSELNSRTSMSMSVCVCVPLSGPRRTPSQILSRPSSAPS